MISKLVSQIIINEDLVQYSLGALYLSLVPKTKLYLVNNYETFMAFFFITIDSRLIFRSEASFIQKS